MKHIVLFKSVTKIFLITILFYSCTTLPLQKEEVQVSITDRIPIDKEIRKGVLDNGLTYYIKKNGKPENKVELRLVVNSGSILENETQLGLAHFVEHMGFNGTKHFEKNELVSYLQSIGVEFGHDLNAYTSFDETVYMLPIPTENPELVDKGLLVLEDWAHNMLFTEKDIDDERGVVLEEYRLGRGAQQRMRDKYFPKIFKNSQYAERLPIGKKEIIENFDYETLRNYYQDWYRPDLMAVIAIGDLDIDEMEQKIKDHFGKIEMPANPKERVYFQVPDHDETLISIEKDKEAPYTLIQLMYKDDLYKTDTWNDYRKSVIHNLYNGMMGQRLNELIQSSDPPFFFAYSGYSGLVRTKNAFISYAVVGPDGVEKGLKALLIENERVKQHGFVESELERYKKEYLNNLEQALKEKDKTESKNYAQEYIRNYLEDEPIPGIEAEYNYTKEILPLISIDEINALSVKWIKEHNRVVVITGPDKEEVILPIEDNVSAWLRAVETEVVEAYIDKVSDLPLMQELPTAGQVIDSKEFTEVGVVELTFSNGVKVVLKPTDFKNDEILMKAYSPGGTSLYSDVDAESAERAARVISESGVSGFSKIDLEKLLAGKIVRVFPYINVLNEGLTGNSAPKDLETMLQLVNLYFTKPNSDQEAFQSMIAKDKMLYPNLLLEPRYYYQDKLMRVMADNHPRGEYITTLEDLEEVNFEKTIEVYQDRFADASDFTFFFVGNFDIQSIVPLLATYLGSLPTIDREEQWIDLGIRPPKGIVNEIVKKGQDQKSWVTIVFTGEADYNMQSKFQLQSLGDVLSIKLIEILREEISGVYGVGAYGTMSKIPYQNYMFNVTFPCGPDNVDKLVQAVFGEINKIKENGPTIEDLEKVKETQRINLKENLKKNKYWINQLQSSYKYGEDINNIIQMDKLIEGLTKDDLQSTANMFLRDDKYIKVTLIPENK